MLYKFNMKKARLLRTPSFQELVKKYPSIGRITESLRTSLTPYNALKRYVTLSETLYPQYITWNRTNWTTRPTGRFIRLVPWYLMSTLLTISATSFIGIIIRQLLIYNKDPDFSAARVLLLLGYIIFQSFGVSCAVTYIFHVDELCFIMNNMQILQNSAGRLNKCF